MAPAERQRPPPGELYLDHVAHFVADLDAAAGALEALGFVVTPASAQRTPEGPAGASNRCAMLEAGYVELLAPTHDTSAALRMRALMSRYGGVHLACFGTPAAAAEHARLAAHGFAPPPPVELARDVAGGTAEFAVVRTAPDAMAEGRVQYVEHRTPGQLWQPELLQHSSGVLGLAALYVVADDPIAAAARWGRFLGALPRPAGEFVELETARGRVLIGARASCEAVLGAAPAAPALAGYALACRDPAAFAGRCRDSGLAVSERAGAFAVALPPALSGAWRLEPA